HTRHFSGHIRIERLKVPLRPQLLVDSCGTCGTNPATGRDCHTYVTRCLRSPSMFRSTQSTYHRGHYRHLRWVAQNIELLWDSKKHTHTHTHTHTSIHTTERVREHTDTHNMT